MNSSNTGTQPIDDVLPDVPAVEASAYLIFQPDGKILRLTDDESLVVGRADCNGDARVSMRHFQVHKVGDGEYEIKDLSSNGTNVNYEALPKKTPMRIRHGDVVTIRSIPSLKFSFHLPDGGEITSSRKKRRLEELDEPSSSSRLAHVDKMEENLFCSVCQDILYKPVSLIPCLHNFCSYCLGQCLKERLRHGSIQCPMSRCEISGFKRNALVESMVDTFLDHNPAKKRTLDEMKYCDDNDILLEKKYDIASFQASLKEDEEDEEVDLSANESESSSEAFAGYCGGCGMGTNDLQHHCAKCQMLLCNQLCKLVKPADVLADVTIFALNFPQTWLKNDVERTALDNIFTSQNVSLSDAVLSKMSEEDKDAQSCKKCCLTSIGEALFKYRVDVPVAELPAAIRNKTKCWWGKNCRTQLSKPEHAQRLNHACEQTRFH